MYEAVLWDFDGTLADTLTVGLRIYNRLAQERGFRPITDPHAVRHMSFREFTSAHKIGLHRVPSAFAAFIQELKAKADSISLCTGVADCVQQISSFGLMQAVVSSNSAETIRRCLQANDVLQHFQTVSGTMKIFGKETRIRKAVKELNVSADRALYVGDELRDIEAARAADVDVASVTWGLNSADALLKDSPNYLLSEPQELAELVTPVA